MALHITDPELEHLIRELAEATGEPVDDAVLVAVREKLERMRSQAGFLAKIKKITDRIAALPTLDDRSADEILGYDEHGLPN
jgi:antitoxin VapB